MSLLRYSIPVIFLLFIVHGLSQASIKDFLNEYFLEYDGVRIDDDAKKFVMNPPFPFFGKSYDTLFVNQKGTITVKSRLNDEESNATCEATVRNFASIAPYWINVESNPERVTCAYKEKEELQPDQNKIVNAFPAFHNFKMKWFLRARWHNMTVNQQNKGRAHFTITAILTTDGVRSFVIFDYEEMLYSYSVPFFSGFDSGDGQKRHMIAANCMNGATIMDKESNVGSPGKWVFRVDKETIYEPGSLCPTTPTPRDGYCHVLDDYTLGSEAACGCFKSVKCDSERLAKYGKCSDESKIRCVQMDNGTLIWAGSPPECEASDVKRTTYYPMVTENPSSNGPIASINFSTMIISLISIMSIFHIYHL